MNQTDWFKKIQEQDVRLTTVQMGQVRESITLEGYSIIVTLGRDSGIECRTPQAGNFKIQIGETPRHLNISFAPMFRKYKDEFEYLFDHLKKQVDEIVDAVTDLFSAIIEEDIPELMLERISGAEMSKEPQDLVKQTAATRFRKLVVSLDVKTPFDSVTFIQSVAKKDMEIINNGRVFTTLSWASLHMDTGQTSFTGTPTLTQCLLFLANYEKISEVVAKFVTAITASNQILSA